MLNPHCDGFCVAVVVKTQQRLRGRFREKLFYIAMSMLCKHAIYRFEFYLPSFAEISDA